MKTLKSKKIQATKKEYARVYENMNLPPRDIVVVDEEGNRHVRYAWSGLNSFGWNNWEQE